MSLREDILRVCQMTPYARQFDPAHEENADAILALVAKAVEKVENPYMPDTPFKAGFEEARQAILKATKEV